MYRRYLTTLDQKEDENNTSSPLPCRGKCEAVIALALVAVAAAQYKPAYQPAYQEPSYGGYKEPAYGGYKKPAYGGYKEEKYEPANYNFAYAVKDDYTYADFGQQEYRDGYNTQGVYYVVLPDGRKQTVQYKADEYGYNADVQYEGEPKYDSYKPGYKADPYKADPYKASPSYHAPSYKAPAYKASPSYHTPTYKAAPSYSAPLYKAPSYGAPAYKAPAY
ncbi:unnamed protein product [Cyprideis torosa]|uniref:Uncharacterized protein n=1 Tax=Cyprideis torosa TaxID=163714 RepID=A0A7R8WLC7_9CRUS|nr:unnamed protein product [Cyprideis torosa]CAG0897080.1 unnamed protein product [Cyprideis torosa]